MSGFAPTIFSGGPFAGAVITDAADDDVIISGRSSLDTHSIPDNPPDVKSPKHKLKFALTVQSIIISTIVFLIIFTWYDLLVTVFARTFQEHQTPTEESVTLSLWFAIFITALGLILLYIIYRAVT